MHMEAFGHVSAFLKHFSMRTTGNLEFRLLKATATNKYDVTVINKFTRTPRNVTVQLVLFAVLYMNVCYLSVVQFIANLPR